MDDPIKACIEYNRTYFSLVDEFFRRTTGQTATDFASVETFSEKIKVDPASIARRAIESYPWFETEFRRFSARHGVDAFKNAKSLGGTNLVMGGSSRFLGSHLESTKAMTLYSDTVFIPDPIMPWLERDRSEERFQHVLILQAAHALLHLKPLVDADLPVPPVFVFPSWEKLLEDNDEQTQKGIAQLITDIFSEITGANLVSIEEVLTFSQKQEDELIRAADQNHLLVAPGGAVNEPLAEALARYDREVRMWRSAEWIRKYEEWPVAIKIVNGISERLSPIYHLIENAGELRSNPLLSVEQQAHYFEMVSNLGATRLQALDVIDHHTIALVNALKSKRLRWLGSIPIDDLARLRQTNANDSFRSLLRTSMNRLHDTELADVNSIAAEVCHDLEVAISAHESEIREIQKKFDRVHTSTAVTATAAAVASLVPALAPLLGAVVPLALAVKYGSDKAQEISEKRQAAHSLMGVLAIARDS